MMRVLIFIAALVVAPFSFAQALPMPSAASVVVPVPGFPRNFDPQGLPAANQPTYAGQSGGNVASTVAGNASATLPNGQKMPIPIRATATVGKAALAKAARAAVKAIPVVSTAIAVAEILNELRNTGALTTNTSCGENACKVDPSAPVYDPNQTGWAISSVITGNPCPYTGATAYGCVQGSGMAWIKTRTDTGCGASTPNIVGDLRKASETLYYAQCMTPDGRGPFDVTPYPFIRQSGNVAKPNPSPSQVKYSDTELEAHLGDFMAGTPDYARRYLEALLRDRAAGRIPTVPLTDIIPVTSPVSVTAPPVTSPQVQVRTEQIPNADGSTSTETTKVTTTVTPVTTGSTVDTARTVYKVTNVTNVTNVNNTTNVTQSRDKTEETEADPEKDDPCAKSVGSVGCAQLGVPPSAERIPTQDVPVTYTPTVFASQAGCPAPIAVNLGARWVAYSISYQPFCDLMTGVRYLFLATAAAACAWIFMESLKA